MPRVKDDPGRPAGGVRYALSSAFAAFDGCGRHSTLPWPPLARLQVVSGLLPGRFCTFAEYLHLPGGTADPKPPDWFVFSFGGPIPSMEI